MGHPVLGNPDPRRGRSGKCPQTIMRVGNAQSRKDTSKRNGQLQQDAPTGWNAFGRSQKPRTQRHIDFALLDGPRNRGDIFFAMLTVGVEGDQRLAALLQREVHSRPQRCALTEIKQVVQQIDGKAARHGGSFVRRSIVHDDDVLVLFTECLQRNRQRVRLVVGRHNDPDTLFAFQDVGRSRKEGSSLLQQNRRVYYIRVASGQTTGEFHAQRIMDPCIEHQRRNCTRRRLEHV